jgi:hypothetical protein
MGRLNGLWSVILRSFEPVILRGLEPVTLRRSEPVTLRRFERVILRAVAGSTLRCMDSATALRFAQNDKGGILYGLAISVKQTLMRCGKPWRLLWRAGHIKVGLMAE